MITSYLPSHISWKVQISREQDIFALFGQSTAKKIKRSLKLLEENNLSYTVDTVDNEYLDLFIPLYEKNILQKHNPKLFDIKQYIADGIAKKGGIYKAITLRRGNEYLGGMIFYPYTLTLSVAFKVFPSTMEPRLPINLALIAEYFLYSYAAEQKMHTVLHGKDRNFYGVNSAIGLAMYKLNAGCRPYISKDAIEVEKITQEKIVKDTLLFLGNMKENPVTKAILYLEDRDKEREKKYQILINSDHFSTDIVYLS